MRVPPHFSHVEMVLDIQHIRDVPSPLILLALHGYVWDRKGYRKWQKKSSPSLSVAFGQGEAAQI